QRYEAGSPIAQSERLVLDEALAVLGGGPLGTALAEVLSGQERLLWVPEEELHWVPVAALRRAGRYTIQDHVRSHGLSGSLVVHRSRARRRGNWGRARVVTDAAALPCAAREGAAVAEAFWRARTLTGQEASRPNLLRWLGRAPAVHFACHAHFD